MERVVGRPGGLAPPFGARLSRRPPRTLTAVSTLAIVLIVVGAVLLLLFLGGLAYSLRRRRTTQSAYTRHIAEADRALEAARAADRGWDRAAMERAAAEGLVAQRPGFSYDSLELVLVDDQPGVHEDRAHFVALAPDGDLRVVLARDASGWRLERLA
jgi:hypothetical protein